MRSCSPLVPTEKGRFDEVLVHCSACGLGDRHILEPPYNYLEKPRRGSQPLGLGRVEVGRYVAACSDEDADGTARSRFWDGCTGSAANVRGSQPSRRDQLFAQGGAELMTDFAAADSPNAAWRGATDVDAPC